eukprot:TRINITY_DN1850_c1_g1_i2.p1 TRINITY_DN1850_c1_g1~~TRINITY_DN1850_c1_g1_i2.p1  ORF type:complete len:173 (-),score=15.29 TRINITY_DN1850_c1_g1_i2:392-880(-)
MRIERCWFCSSKIYPGHGIVFVRNDATIFRFCRSKCHKNFKMKRNPRKVKWTKAFRKLAGKELSKDASLEFERRRNRGVKYNRENFLKLLNKQIPQIQKIKQAREERLWLRRMARAKKLSVVQKRNQLEREIHLVQAPKSLLKDRQKIKLMVKKTISKNKNS